MTFRKLFVAIAFGLGFSVQTSAYDYKTVPGDPMQTRIYTLDNGLKVYLSVNKEKPRLQTYIAVRTGSRNDPAETTGLAHYLEHLMFKGSTHFGSSDVVAEAPLLDSIQNRFEAYRRLTDKAARKKAYHEIDSISQLAAKYNIPNEYDKLMASIGAEGTNAYTSNDVTCYVEDIPSNEIDTWAKIESDRFKNMVIRGFHTELEAVYEEFNIGLAKDNNKEWNALAAKLFPGHPYGTQTTIGTQEHLKNPSILNIKNYYNRYYVPNNVAICMAGDFDPDKVMAIIDKYFGDWKKNDQLSRPEYAPVRDLTAPVDTTVVGLEAENLMMGWKAQGAASYQADTLDVITNMLSNGKAGIFDLNLNAPMKVQAAQAGYMGMADYGQFILIGMPKQGQSLEEVRKLMLAEIDKLKKGQFADNLLPAVVNNMKLDYYRSLQDNSSRADKFVDAFINGKKWSDEVNRLDRISKMTRQQIVDFANRFFLDNYVTVFKRQGNDTTIHKIEKPSITPIPTNNDKRSQFLQEVVNLKADPIQPSFVDYKKDLTKAVTKKGVEVLYKQNTEDELFTLAFHYPFGTKSDNRYEIAAGYLDYVGTAKLSNQKLNQLFYDLACSYKVNVGGDAIDIVLTGLNSSMPKALRLLETVLNEAKANKATWNQFVELLLKSRADAKSNQGANFSALRYYGMYGKYNAYTNQMSEKELRAANPQTLLNLLRDLKTKKHTLLYYGPTKEADLDALVSKVHLTPKTLAPAPAAKEYTALRTTDNEVWIAPYDAKNIYLMMLHNEGTKWNADKAAVEALFNEYFGGGMNAIVFQELREARGLAYSASASYSRPARPQDDEMFFTYIITQNDKMMDCVNEFLNLLNNTPEREANFKLAQQALIKSLATARTTKFGVLASYLRAQKMGLDYDLNQKIYETLPKLQLKDVMNFAKENIANKNYRYLILGDEKNLDMKALEKIATVKRFTTNEIFGE